MEWRGFLSGRIRSGLSICFLWVSSLTVAPPSLTQNASTAAANFCLEHGRFDAACIPYLTPEIERVLAQATVDANAARAADTARRIAAHYDAQSVMSFNAQMAIATAIQKEEYPRLLVL